jgi:hypothetical protein
MTNSSLDICANLFKVYICDYIFMMRIKVSDGPLSNGNNYAELEVYYKSNDYDSVDKVYYVEYGANPIRKYIGSNVIWNNDIDYNNDSLIVLE